MKRTSSITKAIAALIYLIGATSAFASHHHHHHNHQHLHHASPSGKTFSPFHVTSKAANVVRHKTTQQLHQNQSYTKLHLSIPRGGGAAAVASSSTGILSDITSKLATVTSTPSGAFNTALVLLGATTAILKLYNKVENDGDGKNGEEVVVSSHLNFCWFLICCNLNMDTSYIKF